MSKVVTQAKQRFLLSNQKKKNEMQPLEDRERDGRQMESESESGWGWRSPEFTGGRGRRANLDFGKQKWLGLKYDTTE